MPQLLSAALIIHHSLIHSLRYLLTANVCPVTGHRAWCPTAFLGTCVQEDSDKQGELPWQEYPLCPSRLIIFPCSPKASPTGTPGSGSKQDAYRKCLAGATIGWEHQVHCWLRALAWTLCWGSDSPDSALGWATLVPKFISSQPEYLTVMPILHAGTWLAVLTFRWCLE